MHFHSLSVSMMCPWICKSTIISKLGSRGCWLRLLVEGKLVVWGCDGSGKKRTWKLSMSGQERKDIKLRFRVESRIGLWSSIPWVGPICHPNSIPTWPQLETLSHELDDELGWSWHWVANFETPYCTPWLTSDEGFGVQQNPHWSQ